MVNSTKTLKYRVVNLTSMIELSKDEQTRLRKQLHYILWIKYQPTEYLDPADFQLALHVLKMHPRFEEKAGCGISSIYVDKSPEWDSRCFFVERKDGTCKHWSYLKALMLKPDISYTADPPEIIAVEA